MYRVSLSYNRSVEKRVLPSIRAAYKDVYSELLNNSKIQLYFKRSGYRFVEIPGMRKFLMRSSYFNHRFVNKISMQILDTRDSFLKAIKESSLLYSTKFHCKLSQKEVDLVCKCFNDWVLPFGSFVRDPEPIDVLMRQNFRASSGLPTPWKKKSEFRDDMLLQLERFKHELLSPSEILNAQSFHSAAFKRNQITNSSLKTRLVFAVMYSISCGESWFDLKFKSTLKHFGLGSFIHGYTQPEISSVISSTKTYHTMSLDCSKFDHTIPTIILLIGYDLLSSSLNLTHYQRRILKAYRNVFLTMPLFHPSLHTRVDRYRGLTSGSGLTSTIGSFAMFSIHCVSLYRYCNRDLTTFAGLVSRVIVSSDDSLICSSRKIDFNRYAKIVKDGFDVDLELEKYSKPDVDEAVFLGSDWVDGKPYRNIDRLFARILFGSGNLPMSDDFTMFCSRCYDILGNTADFERIWGSFKVGNFSSRVFRNLELNDFSNQSILHSKMQHSKEKRGVWENLDLSVKDLNEVWLTR